MTDYEYARRRSTRWCEHCQAYVTLPHNRHISDR